jgi:hypothetical protein
LADGLCFTEIGKAGGARGRFASGVGPWGDLGKPRPGMGRTQFRLLLGGAARSRDRPHQGVHASPFALLHQRKLVEEISPERQPSEVRYQARPGFLRPKKPALRPSSLDLRIPVRLQRVTPGLVNSVAQALDGAICATEIGD